MSWLRKKWFRFSLWGGLYLIWVIWLGNYWWLLGLPVIFDIFISHKVHWAFWRKKNVSKQSGWVEWIDAIIFAVIAASFIRIFFIEAYKIPTGSMEKSLMVGDYLFVSKLSYGPKVPQTPLSFPLVHNVMPIIGGESYSTLIHNKFRRLKGLGKVKRNDIVVFGFPEGDTVLKAYPMDDYYQILRQNNYDRAYTIKNYGPIIVRPVDKLDNYVKRCVAIPGDTLKVVNAQVYINGRAEKHFPGQQSSYTIYTNGTAINSRILDHAGIDPGTIYFEYSIPGYANVSLTQSEVKTLEKLDIVKEIREEISYPGDRDSDGALFPAGYSEKRKWNVDNYGPLWIPRKGDTVSLNMDNLPVYYRIIATYEKNDLQVRDSRIFINGKETETYRFKQDYYFMMGDNRHNSLDSRYFGFVPEDHIVGTPVIIWFSSDKYKSFPSNIRWRRILKTL
ncbi:MAG: signal peptidase I [Bacteroidales bacterium]|nr:signal peptidase I [Bacteroidales bacterium]